MHEAVLLQAPGGLSALAADTGQVLWEREIEGFHHSRRPDRERPVDSGTSGCEFHVRADGEEIRSTRLGKLDRTARQNLNQFDVY